ncbi:methyl-accepting chemotaxis protein [Clostridium aciditolerans]|uniref:Methyl-accepting chemotaxis protein n=1 Tax=Clostridium aciditolerans TaxID=339861 RepID=A0A934HVZ1_9CLOT|nr:methyl-accepting chemotaxis protein [Clostridium aciditolerans]MBI6871927.1 methyl-accepting chemotaxis protein [Clostridium aciditolerans]
MMTTTEVKTFKMIAEMQIDQISGGAIYFLAEGDRIVWSLASDNFRIKALEVGQKLNTQSCTLKAINEKKTLTMKIPRSVYGTRIIATSMPVVDETGVVSGAVTIVYPRLHPVAAAFDEFAPILSEMFPEGVLLYVTDLHKIINRQGSKEFDIPNVTVGYELKESDIASKTIKSKSISVEEVDANRYGVPVLILNHPMFDEDNADVVVGTFGMVIPKGVAFQLREMSNNVDDSLGGVSAAIEELASSAAQIHSNERELNTALKEVNKFTDEINTVLTFIREIAEKTNMLGLNAAIEAARAGDSGRGFSVVANEIRKLSSQIKSSVPKIKSLTENIKNKVDDTGKISEITLQASEEQSAATEEITASIEEISSLTEELNKISQKL